MGTHSSLLSWEIPGAEEPGGLQSMGSQESVTTKRLSNKTAATAAWGIGHFEERDQGGLSKEVASELRKLIPMVTINN